MLSLEQLLEYKNPRVVHKFRTYFDVDESNANEIFVEMLKWLWLCATAHEDRRSGNSDVPPIMNVRSGMVILDEMWHTFILHTEDYVAFCEASFGFYLHHSPGHLGATAPTPEDTERQLSYMYDRIDGETTIARWYVEYAERYSPENIKKLEKPRVFGRACFAL